MNTQDTNHSAIPFGKWIKSLLICGLILFLLIPSFYVRSLVNDRANTRAEAVSAATKRWGGSQVLGGPLLAVPFISPEVDSAGRHYQQTAYFMPEQLDIRSNVDPTKRKRGIFDFILYTASIEGSGYFTSLAENKLNVNQAGLSWDKARILFYISDPAGLRTDLQLKLGDETLTLSALPGQSATQVLYAAPVNLLPVLASGNLSYSFSYELAGSGSLYFQPGAHQFTAEMKSRWTAPSFNGSSLPTRYQLDKSGFDATWKEKNGQVSWLTAPNTSQPGVTAFDNAGPSFGTDFYVSVSDYTKVDRSVKYAILFILLTFAGIYLVELAYGRNVHIFQYALVGFALILFYTLLLSVSEYLGFDAAYGISALATILLISWFVKGILASTKLTIILSSILVILYTYVFTILQLEDYALLMGSIGLFLMLAVIMYFSRRNFGKLGTRAV